MAKFQKSTAAAKAPPPQKQPPQKQPQQQRPKQPPMKPISPIPTPPLKGASGGLNLVEIQRRIAEAKSRLSSNPAAAAAVSFAYIILKTSID
jgi:hypothetical protein